MSLPLGMHENNTITTLKPGHTPFVVHVYTYMSRHERTCFKQTGLSHTLINKSQSEGFASRVEFLTWKLALNPICTGRHIFGQSSATADRENEPSIPYNVAWLLSYLPPTNSNLLNFCTLWNSLNLQPAKGPNIFFLFFFFIFKWHSNGSSTNTAIPE